MIPQDKTRYCSDCMKLLYYDRDNERYRCGECRISFSRENSLTKSQLEDLLKNIQAEAERLK